MKTSAILVAAAAAVAAAQSVEELVAQIPQCILPCIVEGAEAAGCEQGDQLCECQNKEVIASSVAVCFATQPAEERCQDISDVEKATQLSDQICQMVLEGGDSTPTTSGGSEPADDPSETGSSDEPEATGDDEDGSDEEGSDDTDSTPTTDDDSEPTESPAAASKLGFAWAGAAAAIAAAAF